MVIGPAAQGISAEFDTYWNDPLAYPAQELIVDPPAAQAIQDALSGLRRDADAYATSPYALAVRDSELAREFRSG